MDIKIVKLINGEELLTQVEEIDETQDLVLNKPMVLVPQPNGLQMVPWLMFAKKDRVVIGKEHVLMMFEPRDELANGYRQQIGALVVAPAGAINKEGKLIL